MKTVLNKYRVWNSLILDKLSYLILCPTSNISFFVSLLDWNDRRWNGTFFSFVWSQLPKVRTRARTSTFSIPSVPISLCLYVPLPCPVLCWHSKSHPTNTVIWLIWFTVRAIFFLSVIAVCSALDQITVSVSSLYMRQTMLPWLLLYFKKCISTMTTSSVHFSSLMCSSFPIYLRFRHRSTACIVSWCFHSRRRDRLRTQSDGRSVGQLAICLISKCLNSFT